MTWPQSQMTNMKNLRYGKCEYPGACCFLKPSSSWERLSAIDSAVKLQHFVTVQRALTWCHRSVTWPDLKMKKNIMSSLNGGQLCQVSALYQFMSPPSAGEGLRAWKLWDFPLYREILKLWTAKAAASTICRLSITYQVSVKGYWEIVHFQ